jgi:hypothetical protein
LAGVRAYINVDEALARWPLYKRPTEGRYAPSDALPDRRLEFKGQVLPFRTLPLDSLVGFAAALLQGEIDAWRWLLNDYPNREFGGHTGGVYAKTRRPMPVRNAGLVLNPAEPPNS